MSRSKTAESPLRLALATLTALVAFAGNSLLCRAALRDTSIDAVSFTTLRLLTGTAMLGLLVWWRRRLAADPRAPARDSGRSVRGRWLSAGWLFAYAAGFSLAYSSLSTATGALLLFGAVQVTMIVAGWFAGERIAGLQWIGLTLATGGLVVLLLPGLERPPLAGAILMLAAGVSWGAYSLQGLGSADPVEATARNFLRATPFALGLAALSVGIHVLGPFDPGPLALASLALGPPSVDPLGLGYAAASGALASGLGYAVWYAVLPRLGATRAAAAQLTVPVLAALGGVGLLREAISLRLAVASIAVLGGVALFLTARRPPRDGARNLLQAQRTLPIE